MRPHRTRVCPSLCPVINSAVFLGTFWSLSTSNGNGAKEPQDHSIACLSFTSCSHNLDISFSILKNILKNYLKVSASHRWDEGIFDLYIQEIKCTLKTKRHKGKSKPILIEKLTWFSWIFSRYVIPLSHSSMFGNGVCHGIAKATG